MQHLIVTDLDGTLLNERKTFDALTISTFQALEARGHAIALATGRHFVDVRGLRRKLGIQAFIVSSNGARIHDQRDRSIYQNNLAPQTAQEILKLAATFDVMIQIFTPTEWLVDRPIPDHLWHHPDSEFSYRLAPLADYHGSDVEKILLFGEPAVLARIEAEIHARYEQQVASLTYTDSHCLEIMALGVSKGVAMQLLMERLNIAAPQVLAFGDNLNDVEMLSVAGRPHVMANAHPRLFELLPAAIRIGHNDEEAVAHTLLTLLA